MKMRCLLVVLFLLICPIVSPAHAATASGFEPASARTIVPDGMREIDLRAVLGSGAISYIGMVNADICAVVRIEEEAAGNELIVLDVQDLSVLSRTLFSNTAYYRYRKSIEDGVFYLLFEQNDADRNDPKYTSTKVTIVADGTISIENVAPERLLEMPGGQTAIRQADDGSLYAVDLISGEDDLLIQGVSDKGSPYVDYELALQYVPCWDDDWYMQEDEDGGSYVLTPIDKDRFYANDYIGCFREFYVHKALDEHRFVYVGYGWEWGAGYGVYDLQTRTDHRITGRGDFLGMRGDMLFGSVLVADANTYEASLLPETVQAQFEWIMAREDGHVDFDISPDGRLLALLGMKSRRSDAHTLTITDIQTGEIIHDYDIDNPFATEHSVAFYDDTHFMLYSKRRDGGAGYMYLGGIEQAR